MSLMLGVDLGGTAIKTALVDKTGKTSVSRSTATPQRDPSGDKSIELIAGLIEEYASEHQLLGVGLVVPGLVDSINGISIYSGTLGWRNLDIVNRLASRTGLKITLEHDVTASGHAENRVGAAKDCQSAVVVAIGTALAASVIIDGEIFHPHPAVGELGHTPTGNSRPCVCGLVGCLEMTASGGALSRNYKSVTGADVTALEIFRRSQDSDIEAKILVDEFIDVLATSFVFVSALIGPEVIVLAGGVSKAGPSFIARLDGVLDKKLSIHRKPRLVQSQLQGESGCIGAGLLAWERLT